MSGVSHDGEERRETPMAAKLKALIRQSGPITVADYMRACLSDREHGYYVTRQAIGRNADFITAPEISQVFGELIGLWSGVVWQLMGRPGSVNLVEIGPGRGTLMADALRAARIVPGFLNAATVHLIESSNVLRRTQETVLAGAPAAISWHRDIASALGRGATIPEGPTIVVANEFLDTQPVSQFVFHEGNWHERAVGLDAEERLTFTMLEAPDDSFEPTLGADYVAKDGDILERNSDMTYLGYAILMSLAEVAPFAALFIDYGHARSGVGDTLQAVSEHRYVSPLFAPGETDLTTQVDFELFETIASAPGRIAIDGPVTQAEFLGRLGIMERASKLMSANPGLANEIEVGVARLMAVPGMGDRFKAIGIRSAGLSPLPGFPPPRSSP